jgi:hypothetical protein
MPSLLINNKIVTDREGSCLFQEFFSNILFIKKLNLHIVQKEDAIYF